MKSVWWRLKVTVGASLIVCLVAYYLGEAKPDFVPRWAAQAVIFLGGGLTLYHAALLKRARRHSHGRPVLLTRGGLYAWVRHPMYTGDLVLYLGLTLLAPGIVSIALFLVGSYALFRQSLVEDQQLRKQHGDVFNDWRQRTWLL